MPRGTADGGLTTYRVLKNVWAAKARDVPLLLLVLTVKLMFAKALEPPPDELEISIVNLSQEPMREGAEIPTTGLTA